MSRPRRATRFDRAAQTGVAAGLAVLAACARLGPDAGGDSDRAAGDTSPWSIDLPAAATCPVGHEPEGVAAPPALADCVAAGPDPILAGGAAVNGQAQLGRLDPATGAFVAYVPGQWAKLQPGLQGAGHVEMRLRLAHAAAPMHQPLRVEIAREVWFDCATRLAMGPSKQDFVSAGAAGGWLPSHYMATIVPMPPWLGCGRWALFRTFWRLPGQLDWQMAQTTLRLYLAETAEPPPP